VFGVVFWAWGLLWNGAAPVFATLPPVQGVMYGVWFVPGVLAGLVVRRPGAAFTAAFTAALVSALLGSSWGATALLYGVVQGAAPELVFALGRYRRYGWATACLAAAAAAVGACLLDLTIYYPTWSGTWQLAYGATVVVSGVVVAGLGSKVLQRVLVQSGVLSAFASGREQQRV
jgi:energy-coupling factor transport system substrate-specific component